MTTWKKHLLAATAALAVVSISPYVSAQGAEHSPQHHAASGADKMAMKEKMLQMHQDMKAKHQAQMHDKLKITPEQEGAWKAFLDSHHHEQHQAPSADERKAMDALTAPARMEKMLEKRREGLAMMQKHVDALKQFYAVLTPEQQKTFDDAHRHMRQHMKARLHQGMEKMKKMRPAPADKKS